MSISSRPKVICVGHTAFDRIYSVDAVVAPPAKVRASAYLEIGGGMAGNAAVAIARLGGDAHFGDPPAMMKLRSACMETSRITVSTPRRCGALPDAPLRTPPFRLMLVASA